MREILFRGKRVDNGEWVCGAFCPDALEQTGAAEPGVMDGYIRRFDTKTTKMVMHEVDRETVGQYTGLTDKNGKKIFEGDIVQTNKYGRDTGTGCNFAGKDGFQVTYEDGGYCLRNEWRRFNLRPDTDYEVIGNIHDNPELIGGAEDG